MNEKLGANCICGILKENPGRYIEQIEEMGNIININIACH